MIFDRHNFTMQPLRFMIQKLFILLVFIVTILSQTSANDFNGSQNQDSNISSQVGTSNQLKYNVPFLVLMSDDEVSVAQLPLIDNGSVSVVYSLIGTGNEQEEEDGIENPGPSTGVKTSSSIPSNADAREYEQMPSSSLQQTTTSLGKSSDSQQIASNGSSINSDGNKFVFNRQEVVISSKDDAGSINLEHKEGKNRPRRRRSNSLNNNAEDNDLPNFKFSTTESNNGFNQQQQKTNSVYAGTAVLESSSPSISSSQNVTSAHLRIGFSDDVTSFGTGKLRVRRGSTKIASTEDDKTNDGTVRFSDFDVHMGLGYAFVSDTTGRIHRFKLSCSSDPIPMASESSSLQKEDHYTPNTIDSTVNSAKSSHHYDDSHASSAQDKQLFRRLENSTSGSNVAFGTNEDNEVDDADVNSERHNSRDSYDANKVDVTHEQSGRHPTTSGRRDHFVKKEKSSNVDSTSESTVDVNQHWFDRNSGRPKIIWSRMKHGLPSSVRASHQHPSLNQQSTERKLLVTEGASPKLTLSSSSSIINSYNSTAEQHMGSVGIEDEIEEEGEDEQQQLVAEQSLTKRNESSDSSANLNPPTTSSSGGGGNGEPDCETTIHSSAFNSKKKSSASLKTEIAIDWLNNLLFVLDKYRLVVIDFDGNNELVLIDDFDINNRPIDIKVDPASGFLFWLQVGTFHNTIYKFDLSVLSLPTATERLLANAPKPNGAFSNNGRLSSSKNDRENSELVALISHHYAHPIITNLPQNARLFTVDHKHSRIYVPLATSNLASNAGFECNKTQPIQDETEVFGSGSDIITHLNNTSSGDLSEPMDNSKNCSYQHDYISRSTGQVLIYNLDGTDVGPLRGVKDRAHLTNLDDMQDVTLDSDHGFLYWLTNDGQELVEEYKTENDSTIYSAQHNLDGKRYKKLKHFGSNQPKNLKPRFNLSKMITMLSIANSANRPVRLAKDYTDGDDSHIASGLNFRNDRTGLARHAPYIILGITCLVVLIVYLIYSFIFQQTPNQLRASSRDGSVSGSSITDSHIDCEANTNGFLADGTISRWITEPPMRTIDEQSNIVRHTNNHNLIERDCVDSCDIESTTNFNTSNAITEHYGDMLTNLTRWPSHMNDMPNKQYVPKEILEDKALSSIPRVPYDQLKFEQCAPLGEGHFGEVLQGSISCTKDEKSCLLHGSNLHKEPNQISINVSTEPFSTGYDDQRIMVQASIGSSGHGSSSTSSEFAPGGSGMHCLEVDNGDYLTPKSHCNSSISDYAVNNQAISSRPDSYSSYYNSSVCQSTNNRASELKIKCSNSSVSTIKVAIKKLKSNASDKEKKDFLQEAKILANCDHPNIIHLIGICLDRGHTYIVMELMLGGDLRNYLLKSVPRMYNSDKLTVDDLLAICLDIVNGCCYLEMLNYIHRDLAARNCLVSSIKQGERVIKLADFGLARDIDKDMHYKKLHDSAMPLKWMAPESLIEQKFTTKSDVWSFAIVMWEVMSYCEKPYENVEPWLMENHLKSGHRLPKPKNCCDDLYDLMQRCWELEPANRPSFLQCKSKLIEIRNNERHYIEGDVV